jgi:SAM-dependent methyltransferase
MPGEVADTPVDAGAGIEAGGLEAEIASFLEMWVRSIAGKDVTAAAALRTPDYRLILPDDQAWALEDELAAIGSPMLVVEALTARIDEVTADGESARVRFVVSFRGNRGAGETSESFPCTMILDRGEGIWRARSMAVESGVPPDAAQPVKRSPGALLRRGAALLRRALLRRERASAASFQALAYLPYRADSDYALPRSAAASPIFDEARLPVPPPELWLGYHYPAHGALHVRTMLDIAEAGGFSFADGDRLLDLGCGAGRMIRHLAPLAERCEIWGADISAEHIYWCQRNLSPPFHFLTSTKVPHLPFPDGSLRFVYCGSLFTHIDDMARAWLLELRRLVRDDGCVYVTIHDENTVRLFDSNPSPPPIVRHLRSSATFNEAKGKSDMFTVGRDDRSQVFYQSDWFERLLAPMFEIVSVTPEAYFYQTALLIRPRPD